MYQEKKYLGFGHSRIFTKQRLIPPGEGCSEVGPAAIVMELENDTAVILSLSEPPS